MDLSRGTLIALLGVGLFVTTMAVGAVTAPDRTIGADDGSDRPGTAAATATPLPQQPQTLVGMQGGWVTHGSLFEFDGHEVAWRLTNADGYFEVMRLSNGNVAAAFSNESVQRNCGQYEAPCGRTGFRIVDPDAPGGPEVVDEYSFATRRQHNREVHAVDALGDGRFVFTDMDRERIAVVDLANDTVVWQWNASSFYDAPRDPTGRDWLHINDVDAIGDGRFLVSVRNANQIVVVERGAGVVEVINADRENGDDGACTESAQLEDFNGDGDIRCGDPDVINHQHNPQWLGNGAVLVADSDNDRVVELHRNDRGRWKPVWVVRKTGGIELDWPRDADRLPNGNTLITDSLRRRVVEVDPDGRAVWSAKTNRIPYEADRLPFDEPVGRYDGPNATRRPPNASDLTPTPTDIALPQLTAEDPDAVNETGNEIPVLSLAVAALRGYPQVPIWFEEFHLGATIVAVLLVVGGGADNLWKRYQRRE